MAARRRVVLAAVAVVTWLPSPRQLHAAHRLPRCSSISSKLQGGGTDPQGTVLQELAGTTRVDSGWIAGPFRPSSSRGTAAIVLVLVEDLGLGL